MVKSPIQYKDGKKVAWKRTPFEERVMEHNLTNKEEVPENGVRRW